MVGTDNKLVVAVTDGDWFDVLRERPELRKINFWSPAAQGFNALKKDELFLFKLHKKRGGMIVGGGFFTRADLLPWSLAWDVFGEANGALDPEKMRKAVLRYRKTDPNDPRDFEIGCRLLSEPFFFKEPDWIPAPSDWKDNIVSFKKYNADEGEGLKLKQAVMERLNRSTFSNEGSNTGELVVAERPDPYLTEQWTRPGQGPFHDRVAEAYDKRCAITREKTLPVLEAAHILPYSKGGSHDVRNGLFLRRDIHSLFDEGYVTVTPAYSFKVSERLVKDYGNGKVYYELQDKSINLPTKTIQRPDQKALAWHNENLFKG